MLALLLVSSSLPAADQPQWGQRWSRNQISDERGLPETFDPPSGANIKWSAPLGTETYATPVVAKGRVLIGTNNNRPRDSKHKGDRSVLLCLDEKDGHLLWQLVMPKLTNSIFWDWPNAGICSVPTVEGDRVYLVGNRGEVLCLDLAGMANGNNGPFHDEARHAVPFGSEPLEPGPQDADILWIFDYVKECGVRQHDQAHGSPLVLGDYLYVNTSNGVDDSHKKIKSPDAPSLIVLDKKTGRLVAQDDEHIGPKIFHSTWSSPALGVVNGREQIIFCGGDGIVYGFEPVSSLPGAGGASVPASRGSASQTAREVGTGGATGMSPLQQGPSPAREDARPTHPGQVATLKKVWSFDPDPTAPKENVHRFNSNRKESPSNIKSMPVFHDNRVFVTVGGDLWWGKHEAWLKCIAATKTGDITKTGEVWSYPLQRHCMATPAIHNGLVFVGDSGQRLHCVDAATGQPLWTHEVRGAAWASPLVADGKVYFATQKGEFLVFAESKEKKLLSEINLGSAINGTPVAANGVLYVTTMKEIFAVRGGN